MILKTTSHMKHKIAYTGVRREKRLGRQSEYIQRKKQFAYDSTSSASPSSSNNITSVGKESLYYSTTNVPRNEYFIFMMSSWLLGTIISLAAPIPKKTKKSWANHTLQDSSDSGSSVEDDDDDEDAQQHNCGVVDSSLTYKRISSLFSANQEKKR